VDDVDSLHVEIDNLNDLLVGFCFIRSIDKINGHPNRSGLRGETRGEGCVLGKGCLRKLQKTTIFAIRVLKNHHFLVSLQKPPLHLLTITKNTDCTLKHV
jgi:hypothetical protein